MHKFKNGESPYKRAKNNLERKYRGDYKGVFRGDYDYKGVSYQSLVALEDERILVKKRVNILLVFSIIFGILVVVAVFKFKPNEGITNLLIMAPFGFYSFFKRIITKNIRNKFKNQVVAKVVKDINPNFVYLKDLHITEEELEKSGIFGTAGRIFEGDDLISGEIENVKFRMSDIRLKEVRKRGKSTQIVDIFKGVVFIAEFYKNFSSHTIVLGSSEATAFGKKIKVDNSEFNKEFRVYTNDEINAFYILSPSFMQRFLKLQKRLGCGINAVFLENKIYLYIDNGRDNFELDLHSSLLQIAVVFDTYKRELENFFQIINDLKLNTKIFKSNFEPKTSTQALDSQDFKNKFVQSATDNVPKTKETQFVANSKSDIFDIIFALIFIGFFGILVTAISDGFKGFLFFVVFMSCIGLIWYFDEKAKKKNR